MQLTCHKRLRSELISRRIHCGATSADQTQNISSRQTVPLSLPVGPHTLALHRRPLSSFRRRLGFAVSWPPVWNQEHVLCAAAFPRPTWHFGDSPVACCSLLPASTELHPSCEHVITTSRLPGGGSHRVSRAFVPRNLASLLMVSTSDGRWTSQQAARQASLASLRSCPRPLGAVRPVLSPECAALSAADMHASSGCCQGLHFSQRGGWKWELIVVLICISLVTSDVGHLLCVYWPFV